MAAHILHQAGIDFVMLEKRDSIVAAHGAGIVLFPHSLRVLDQLGLLDKVRAVSIGFDHTNVVTRNGYHYNTLYQVQWAEENHGIGWMYLHRPDLFRVLYESLPEPIKARLLTNKKMENIETTPDGVIVRCSDGTTEEGSIVIGADGIHSQTRMLMGQLALQESPDAPINEERPYTAHFRCLFGNTSRTLQGFEAGETWDSHSPNFASQMFGGKDKIWFLVYDKLETPTRETTRYGDDGQDQFVKRWGDTYVIKTLRLKDVYNAREWSVLSDIHEGVLKRFSWGRIVLVGDAAHKMTPNMGQGWNVGVQDVVVLTNLLRGLLDEWIGQPVEGAEVEKVFEAYQSAQYEEVIRATSLSGATTRNQTWQTWKDWWLDRWYIPWTGGARLATRRAFGPIISAGHVLDFLPEKSHLEGLLPWHYASK
ncbi:FAD/NAD(P)-binding domain-containing protein, partial [Thozetella sp. PMI_491]